MTSTRPPRRAVAGPRRSSGGDQPVRIDGALRQTVALLELVQQEEALLGWLDDCVAQLHAVRRARQTLLDLTDLELDEAKETAGERGAGGSRASGSVGYRDDASESTIGGRDCGGSAS